jgi:hypothetical protein
MSSLLSSLIPSSYRIDRRQLWAESCRAEADRFDFWPDGVRMVVSVSMQMEGGAQPARGAENPMPKIDPKYPDLPAAEWYDYGYKEGLPRLLEVFERRKIKVTSHMVGSAVDLHPALAKEIVQRGHEASGHGQTWTAQFSMTPEEERVSYQQSIESIERATGTQPVGFNAFWLRGTPHTLNPVLYDDTGFVSHHDADLSCQQRALRKGHAVPTSRPGRNIFIFLQHIFSDWPVRFCRLMGIIWYLLRLPIKRVFGAYPAASSAGESSLHNNPV